MNKKFRWFLTLSSKNYAIWLIFECARAKMARIYYIGAAELPLRFPRCAPLLRWRYLYPWSCWKPWIVRCMDLVMIFLFENFGNQIRVTKVMEFQKNLQNNIRNECKTMNLCVSFFFIVSFIKYIIRWDYQLISDYLIFLIMLILGDTLERQAYDRPYKLLCQ